VAERCRDRIRCHDGGGRHRARRHRVRGRSLASHCRSPRCPASSGQEADCRCHDRRDPSGQEPDCRSHDRRDPNGQEPHCPRRVHHPADRRANGRSLPEGRPDPLDRCSSPGASSRFVHRLDPGDSPLSPPPGCRPRPGGELSGEPSASRSRSQRQPGSARPIAGSSSPGTAPPSPYSPHDSLMLAAVLAHHTVRPSSPVPTPLSDSPLRERDRVTG
jgi:hypothetical protein